MEKPLKIEDLIILNKLDKEIIKINTLLRERYNSEGFCIKYDINHLTHEERIKIVEEYSNLGAKLCNGEYANEPWTLEISCLNKK